MKILIGVPAYGDAVRVNCTVALMGLQARLSALGVPHEAMFLSMARIEAARAALASRVLRDETFSHLLFVDSDVGFRPEAVVRMLQKDVPVAACVYPSRSLDLAALYQASKSAGTAEVAIARAATYPALGDPGEVPVQDGWVAAPQAPTGLMLIKREVFVTLAEAYPDLVIQASDYAGLSGSGPVLQCFTALQRDDGLFMGEDYSFCRRWVDTGGQIHVLLDETLSHAGVNVVEGCILTKLTG